MKQRWMRHAVALTLLVAGSLTVEAGSITSSSLWDGVRAQTTPDIQPAHYWGYGGYYGGYYRPYYGGYYHRPYYGGYYRPYYRGYYGYNGYSYPYYGRNYYYGRRYYGW